MGALPLPEHLVGDLTQRKTYVPEAVHFQTKPQIAVDLIGRVLANGIRVSASTFDELYGRNDRFLDMRDE
ncbi:hypothetical protein GC176_13510 [bacterium]|nr:hypothetical protein [bacterium]